jgi:hypothetical protein
MVMCYCGAYGAGTAHEYGADRCRPYWAEPRQPRVRGADEPLIDPDVFPCCGATTWGEHRDNVARKLCSVGALILAVRDDRQRP